MEIVAASRKPVRATAASAGLTVETAARSWQEELRLAIRDPAVLLAELDLPNKWLGPAKEAAQAFPLFVPLPYLRRIRSGDSGDPLLRQVLPLGEELVAAEGFTSDPVGDAAATQIAGMLQKYSSRALLITTGACAVHCRYCFRREFPYSEGPRSQSEWKSAVGRIAKNPQIDEVILSGGDPLTIVDGQLTELVQNIAAIPHVRRLRVHTRLPIMIPQRVTSELVSWLRGTRLAPVMVIHANHPAEIDDDTGAALARLVDAGIPVLNQAVLLAGVNDALEPLVELSRRLVDLRVMPYYLHQLDRVQGARHFEVPIARGQALIAAMRAELPGYAVPRYVQEIAGETHKRVLA